jgi:hypothetical protein
VLHFSHLSLATENKMAYVRPTNISLFSLICSYLSLYPSHFLVYFPYFENNKKRPTRNFSSLDQSHYFLEIAPQLSSQGCVDPIPNPLLLRKFGSAGNRTWTSGPVARNPDH